MAEFVIHLPDSQTGFSVVKASMFWPPCKKHRRDVAEEGCVFQPQHSMTESVNLISCLIWTKEFNQVLNALKVIHFKESNVAFRKKIYKP